MSESTIAESTDSASMSTNLKMSTPAELDKKSKGDHSDKMGDAKVNDRTATVPLSADRTFGDPAESLPDLTVRQSSRGIALTPTQKARGHSGFRHPRQAQFIASVRLRCILTAVVSTKNCERDKR